jgi:hypothetical protein
MVHGALSVSGCHLPGSWDRGDATTWYVSRRFLAGQGDPGVADEQARVRWRQLIGADGLGRPGTVAEQGGGDGADREGGHDQHGVPRAAVAMRDATKPADGSSAISKLSTGWQRHGRPRSTWRSRVWTVC